MKKSRSDIEIDNQRDSVYGSGNERTCHNSRVKTDFLCQHRQNTTNDFRTDNRYQKCTAYHKSNRHTHTVNNHQLTEIGDSKSKTAQKSYSDFFPDNFQNIFELNFFQRKSTNNRNRRL